MTKISAAVLCAAAVGIAGAGWFVVAHRGAADAVPASLAEDVAGRVVPLVEAEMTARRQPATMVCVVRVLGVDPRGATALADVRQAYVWSLCASAGTEARSESSMPMAVDLSGSAGVRMPEYGDYTAQVESLFPKRLQDAAFDGGYSDALEQALQNRLRSLPKASPR
ncbi:hypothetical protein [Actinoplanes sp. L3-i22]|uniref:hypothetical protein n=1 Tax=Actinoplanes sp. L3-i22 TaxID=2836373 RepID=UPI001C77566A|nr:hypothetical protein [Actinoplanes sp. L3-i22]BCY10581.1 hypothetical protein L3i22_056690 [Actinoplanes sp. L3-i22]